MRILKKIFLNEHFILSVIILNAAIIFAQESGCDYLWLQIADLVCTIIFIIEMGGKAERVWHTGLLARWLEPLRRHFGDTVATVSGGFLCACRCVGQLVRTASVEAATCVALLSYYPYIPQLLYNCQELQQGNAR